MDLSARERVTLAVCGLAALTGMGVLLWQRRAPPLIVQGATPAQAAAWDQALSTARRVDVNRATATELERLPGIGPSLAGRIVAYRDLHGGFNSPEELGRVPGIGPKTLAGIRDYIAAGPQHVEGN